jgi:uncharacterized protein involved in response to NO
MAALRIAAQLVRDYFAPKHWSWNDLLFALVPYVVAGFFAYLVFWESKGGKSRGRRIGAAATLLLFAGLLALSSINISSSQAAALELKSRGFHE